MPNTNIPRSYALGKRAFDLTLSSLCLVLLVPRMLWSLLRAPHALPPAARSLWKVLLGEWSIVGPRAVAAGAFSRAEEAERATAKPGMTCIYWLRRQTNIAFDGEMAYDREYLTRRCLRLDLKLTVKTFIALCYGRGPRVPFQNHISILGTPIDNLTMNEALNRIEQTIDTPAESPLQISFVNPDCLNKACTDAGYRRVLKTSDLVLADGIGLRIAGSLLHRPVRENVNGTDMFPLLCARLNQRGGRLFLLGARAEIVAAVAEWVRTHYPQVVVCGARDGFFARNAPVIEQINQAQPDVLLVAMGAPKQEAWIALHRHELDAKVCLGVGGLFDFYSGHTPRAPLWLREIGLEWTYRLYQEPGRMWRRYLIGNLVFLARVLRERFGAPQPAVSKVPVSR